MTKNIALLLLSTLFMTTTVLATNVFAADCGGVDTALLDCGDGATTSGNAILTLLRIVINVLAAGVGVVAVAGIVYGAFLYTTAENNQAQIANAVSIIRNVIIGLVVFGGMYGIVQFIIPGGIFNRTLEVSSKGDLKDAQYDLNDYVDSLGENGKAASDGVAKGTELPAYNLTFMTYNVRTSNLNNEKLGDPDSVFDTDDQKRMAGIAGVIKSEGASIVTAQEVRGSERGALLANLPSGWKATNVTSNGDTVILYDSGNFTMLKSGTFRIDIFSGITRPQRWALFSNKETKSELFVFDTHLSTQEPQRGQGARQMISNINKIVGTSNTPFVLAGDMNSNDSDPTRISAYRAFQGFDKIKYARAVAANKINDNCDTQNSKVGTGGQDCRPGGRGSHIDQVWVSKSPSISVSSYRVIANAETSMYSDHNGLLTKLSIGNYTKGK